MLNYFQFSMLLWCFMPVKLDFVVFVALPENVVTSFTLKLHFLLFLNFDLDVLARSSCKTHNVVIETVIIMALVTEVCLHKA